MLLTGIDPALNDTKIANMLEKVRRRRTRSIGSLEVLLELQMLAEYNALTLVDLLRRSGQQGSRVQVGFNFRFCAGMPDLRRGFASLPYHVQAIFLSRHPSATGLPHYDSVLHWLKVNGVHLIDLLVHLGGGLGVERVRSQRIRGDRFLLQIEGAVGGTRTSLLLGNTATKFTMQVTIVDGEGEVIRMMDPGIAGCSAVAGAADAAVNARPDRLVALGYADELDAFMNPDAAESGHRATLRDALRAVEVIERIGAMLDHA